VGREGGGKGKTPRSGGIEGLEFQERGLLLISLGRSGADAEGIEDGDKIVDVDDAIASGRGDVFDAAGAGAEGVEDRDEVVDIDDAVAAGGSDITEAGGGAAGAIRNESFEGSRHDGAVFEHVDVQEALGDGGGEIAVETEVVGGSPAEGVRVGVGGESIGGPGDGVCGVGSHPVGAIVRLTGMIEHIVEADVGDGAAVGDGNAEGSGALVGVEIVEGVFVVPGAIAIVGDFCWRRRRGRPLWRC